MPQVHIPIGSRPKLSEIRSNALVALGGNIPSQVGEPAQTFVNAVEMLSRQRLAVCAISRFFRTPCFPEGAGPDYVNGAISLATDLEPEEILGVLHRVEAEFGRQRVQRWGMRTLDLDLLAVGSVVAPDAVMVRNWIALAPADQVERTPDKLLLPHPRIQNRAFVLAPLLDIAPNWLHPLTGETVEQMWARLPIKDRADVVPL